MEDLKFLNALYLIPGLGSGALRQIFGYFQSGKAAWDAEQNELENTGIGPVLIKTIITSRPMIDPNKEWEKLQKENISILFFTDENFPPLLKEIPSSPSLLYVKGNIDCLKMPMVAIVGSRKFTSYGKQAAERFARDLARAGICVVSGLALGIDAIAHRGALDANGKTIAVLGNSLDNESISPRANYCLSKDILQNDGLLISEFPVPTAPTVGTFPARNRIMAGISLGTLVIEAAEKSGSLITANLAIEFNREVFAVPGPIFSTQSEGTNNLIKKGAKLTGSVADILEEIQIESNVKKQEKRIEIELTEQEKMITQILSPEPTHIDRISRLAKLETSTIGANLAMLEIKGIIRNIGGQNYIKL